MWITYFRNELHLFADVGGPGQSGQERERERGQDNKQLAVQQENFTNSQTVRLTKARMPLPPTNLTAAHETKLGKCKNRLT